MYMDSLGDNCVTGQMSVQIIFHRPPTPKYGCYAPGGVRGNPGCHRQPATFYMNRIQQAAWLAVRLLQSCLRGRQAVTGQGLLLVH